MKATEPGPIKGGAKTRINTFWYGFGKARFVIFSEIYKKRESMKSCIESLGLFNVLEGPKCQKVDHVVSLANMWFSSKIHLVGESAF
jgi:hypothetical protein